MRIAAFYAHPIPRAIPSATAAARRALLPCQRQRQRHIPRRPGRRDLCSAASWPRGVCAATTTAGHIRPALPSPPGGSFTSPSTLPLASLLRGMATATATTTTASEPKFSAGSDEVALRRALETLLLPGSGAGGGGGRWALVAGGEGLERSFRFKTFAKTWDFMTAVALQCKIKNHHPEWSNVYNTTYIRWTTHNPRGLSAKDVELAAACDALARDFGEQEVIADEQQRGREKKEQKGNGGGGGDGDGSCEMRRLADRGAASAGDCCGPRK